MSSEGLIVVVRNYHDRKASETAFEVELLVLCPINWLPSENLLRAMTKDESRVECLQLPYWDTVR